MGVRQIEAYFERISLGKTVGKSRVGKFGYNEAVGAIEEIVSIFGIYGLPATADTVIATSTSVDDVVAGDGARKLRVFGLDENFDLIQEDLDMGTTSVKSFLRVFRIRVIESGTITPTLGGNLGNITITQTGGTPMVAVPQYEGSTLCACFTVPRGYKALIWQASTTVGEGKDSLNRIKVRSNKLVNSPFTTEGIRSNFENQVGRELIMPSVVDEMSDILFTSVSSAAGTAVSATFDMELIKE